MKTMTEFLKEKEPEINNWLETQMKKTSQKWSKTLRAWKIIQKLWPIVYPNVACEENWVEYLWKNTEINADFKELENILGKENTLKLDFDICAEFIEQGNSATIISHIRDLTIPETPVIASIYETFYEDGKYEIKLKLEKT
jgi:hypothetical protein